jgi:beta-xylosidase
MKSVQIKLTQIILPCLFFTVSVININAQNMEWGKWEQWGDIGDGTYQNPIIPADFSDPDCIRVGKNYYAISSTMQYAPGMVVLHSLDLVNWEIIGHAVTDLTQISPDMNWDRMSRYGRGIWAGSIRHHKGLFYVVFGTPDEGYFLTTAKKAEGPWTPLHPLLTEDGWDDCCIDWDEQGQPWFVGTCFKDNYKTYLFRMTPDARQIDRTSAILLNEGFGREANKLLSYDGWHYLIYSEHKSLEGRYVMAKRSREIGGPYDEERQLTRNVKGDREPNQGGIVQGKDGQWYFLTHHGSGEWEGRAVSLLPVTWTDGWPVIGKIQEDGIGTMTWTGKMPAKSHRYPIGVKEEFKHTRLSQSLEWNYQPRADKYSLTDRKGWLRLKAFAPIRKGDFLTVGNILTTRVFRTSKMMVETCIDLSGLSEGTHVGLCHLTKESARIEVVREQDKNYIELISPDTTRKGPVVNSQEIWLRSEWGLNGESLFSYSLDGTIFIPFGPLYTLKWAFYRGDRVGIYCYNELADEGYADFNYIEKK